MITRPVNPNQINRKAREIRVRVPAFLTAWGLVPKFKRWRLTQDPDTGLAVLFGVLDNKFIAAHTTIPFSDYFDPRLLSDLETELKVQVMSSNSDGLRYAFVLENGELNSPRVLEALPPPMPEEPPDLYDNEEMPFLDNDSVSTGAHTLMHHRLDSFLKMLRSLNAPNLATRQPPNILLMDEAEYNHLMGKYQPNQGNLQTA